MAKIQNTEEVDTIVSAFTDYLKKQNKLDLLPEISKRLSMLVRGELAQGTIVSAVPVTADQIRKIEERLTRKFGNKIELVNVVNPAIIGGIIVQFGDVVIDESVKSKLNAIEEKLYGSY